MSFNEVLAGLPALTVLERQILIRRAVELDESDLTDSQVLLVEERLASHRADPGSAISLNEMKAKIRAENQK